MEGTKGVDVKRDENNDDGEKPQVFFSSLFLLLFPKCT